MPSTSHSSGVKPRADACPLRSLVVARGLSLVAGMTLCGSVAVAQGAYRVERFEIQGGPLLDEAVVEEATRTARGDSVSLAEIRRALVRLQQAFRERGFSEVGLKLPQQPLTNGIVRVQVLLASPVSPESGALPGWTVPTFDVRHFEVRGNTILSAEEIDRLLGPAAGASVGVAELETAAKRLQSAYAERGYLAATVTLPGQVMTDGSVVVVVREGLSPESRGTVQRVDPPAKATIEPKVPTFEVRRYEVLGNSLLSSSVVDGIFAGATGSTVTLPQVQKALGELQLAYRERGFATVSVALPPQQLTNAVVKVQVTEGLLTEIAVAGNRHFSSNNVMRSLPSLRTNTLLNSLVFQRELDAANQNRDRQIYPTIGPGPDLGSSSLTLRVKDRVPLHGRVEVNNQATPGTPEWRINSSAQYNNLWQREHQVGASYGFSPEEYKAPGLVTDYGFNRPLIANLGGYYRFPFGSPRSVEERIASDGKFGFDEATRQFRLPPASGRPEVSVFGSTSSSDTGVQNGPTSLVSQTPLLTILSRDSGRNVTANDSAGARLSLPWAASDVHRWSFSAGPDWKRFAQESFNTNNFLITTVITNAQGSQVIESVVSSPQPVRSLELQYLPLSLSADYSSKDQWGTTSASAGAGGNWVGEAADFASASYTTNASPSFGRLTLSITRDQKLPRDFSLLLRGSGQWSTGALISNEQFSLGGLNSVRGYYEGDVFGDAGWFTSAELRTPYVQAPVPIGPRAVPVWLRASVFVDYGRGYHLETVSYSSENITLWGAGIGASANVNNVLDVRLSIGWPLIDSPNRKAGDPRAYFSVGGQF